jgi:DNA-binding NarL/FixJ family response regulator
VLVVSHYAEPLLALMLIQTGPGRRGYLLKARLHRPAQMATAIKSVAQGGVVIDPALVDILFDAASRLEPAPLAELSPRERRVLGEFVQGKSNAAIADSLALTRDEIEHHVTAIVAKLGLPDATDITERVKAVLVLLTGT